MRAFRRELLFIQNVFGGQRWGKAQMKEMKLAEHHVLFVKG
jgi:hypothetical protein